MTTRTRAATLIAAITLSLALTGAAVAQTTQDATVELKDNVSGNCFAAANSGTFALGSWTWDGGKYVYGNDATGGTVTVDVTQTISSENRTCYVSATGGTLTQRGADGTTEVTGGATIPAMLQVNNGTSPATVDTPATGTAATVTASVSPAATLPSAVYKGTVTISADKSSG